MIVKCASCQTRFKIGDDKVTEKGVKVRCTKCGTVFVVRKGDEPSVPAPTSRSKLPLPPSSAGSLDDLFAVPVPSAAPAPSPTSVVAGADDPFAGFLAGSPPPPPKNNLLPGEFALADLEPSAPSIAPPPGATPMSDLLGLDNSWPAAPAAAPPPPPIPGKNPPSKPPKRPAAADAPDPFDAALDPLGSPGSVHPPPDPFAGLANEIGLNDPASFGLSSNVESPGDPGFDPLAGLSLNAGTVPHTGEEPADGGFDSPPANDHLEATPPRPRMQPAIESVHQPIEATVERQTKGRNLGLEDDDERIEKPLSVKVLNTLAGASVVILLLLGFIAYRNSGRLDLRDPLSAFFSAFGFSRPKAVSQSLNTHITASGLYSNLRGDPILFVRGSVENLSGGPQRVGLKLEVSSQGQVVATAEGLPGLFASPEDLFQAKNAPEVKAVIERVFAAPTAPIPAGGRSDFLLLLPEVPAPVLGATDTAEIKVTAHPLVNVADAPPRAAIK